MKCSNCGRSIDDRSTFCGYCGQPVAPQQPADREDAVPARAGGAGRTVLVIVLSVILALILLFAVLFFLARAEKIRADSVPVFGTLLERMIGGKRQTEPEPQPEGGQEPAEPAEETPVQTPSAAPAAGDAMLYVLTPSAASNMTPGFRYYDYGHDNEDCWYANGIGGYQGETENWCEYRVDGAYRSISGVIYLNYDHREETNAATRVSIYGDDRILFLSDVVTQGMAPQRFRVDITDVKVLRICVYGADMVRLSDCLLSASEDASVDTRAKEPPANVTLPTPTPAPTPTPTPAVPERLLVEYTPDLSSLRILPAAYAAATSELTYKGYVYKAGDAIDGDLTTCWQEDVPGDGIGESLTVYYDQTVTVDALRLRLGYASFYDGNGRPRTLQFTFSDGTQAQYDFADTNRNFYLRLTRPVSTSELKLTILDAYTGAQCEDTCITEVTAYAQSKNGNAAIPQGNSRILGYINPNRLVGKYGVQVGAFAKIEAAEDYAKTVQASENKLGNTVDILITFRGKYYVTCLGTFETLKEASFESNLLNTESYGSYAIKFESN